MGSVANKKKPKSMTPDKTRQRLIDFRHAQGYTQEQLGAELGCGGAFISHIEAGRKGVGLEFAFKLQDLTADAATGQILAREWLFE